MSRKSNSQRNANYVDLSSFPAMADHLIEDYSRNLNTIIRSRLKDNPLKTQITVNNVRLKRMVLSPQVGLFEPDLSIPKVARRNYYVNMSEGREAPVRWHVTISEYATADYQGLGLPLRFSLLNHIRVLMQVPESFLKGVPLFPLSKELLRRRFYRSDTFGHHFQVTKFVRDQGTDVPVVNEYHFEEPWTRKPRTYYYDFSPAFLYLMAEMAARGEFSGNDKLSHQWNWLLQLMENCGLDEWTECKEFGGYTLDVQRTDVAMAKMINIPRVLPFVDDRTMRGIIEALSYFELPVLMSILRGSIECLTDDHIKFLSSLTDAARRLKEAAPNAMTELIYDLIHGPVRLLVGRRAILQCPYCSRCIRYDPRYPQKRHCTLRADNRNCGTKARNKRDYARHSSKRREHYRREVHLDRELRRRLK